MIIFGVLGMRMRRYADASKALQTGGNMDDAEQCFINSTSFFKNIRHSGYSGIYFRYSGRHALITTL